jgi:hypothetical protein
MVAILTVSLWPHATPDDAALFNPGRSREKIVVPSGCKITVFECDAAGGREYLP